MNGVGTSINRTQATNESLGKNGTSDLFCSFKSASGSDTTKFTLKWMGEINAPHKVEKDAFQTALPHGHVIDLRQSIFGDNEVRNTVVEIIIQLYSAMVDKGVRYGYTDTGKATLYIRIDSTDPAIIYYHVSCPSSDVDDDDRKMHLSAVSQRLAFTVQAIQAPASTREWVIKAGKLRQRKHERDHENDYSSGSSPKEAKDHSARRPRVVESERDPFNTRSAARNRLAAEVEREEEASDSDSVSGKKTRQNLGMHNRPDRRRKMQNDSVDRSYCTYECVRGLTFGTPLDKNCPNVKDHGSKHISRQDFLRLMGEQLVGEEAHANCEPINASGHIGHLFKIRLLSHGYTLVAKAVGISHGAPLIHEENMYNHLRALQGRFIPACPGRITLEGLLRGEAYTYGAFRHFLFLSYAGKPVLEALFEVDNSVVSQVLATLAQLHQHRVMHHDAAPRNMLYDTCTGRYMVVDLEMSKPIDREVLEAMNSYGEKRKRKRELKAASESFAAESKSLLAKLLSSARACC
ncbi:hypothetical protein E4U59_000471 [Claviceps monticola]|nr:hypothetical protein E4U59_000471 [Claviceps monticola]